MNRAELISLNALGIGSMNGSLRVLGLIFSEALLLGHIGGVMGVFLAITLLNLIPMIGEAAQPIWTLGIFARALTVALLLGLMGGLYPALRATSLEPVKALRYECGLVLVKEINRKTILRMVEHE